MSFRIRRVLVAIRDDGRASRTLLHKAAALARANDARVELFHAISEPAAIDALRRRLVRGQAAREIIDSVIAHSEQRLAKLAADKEFRGLKVSCRATWDYPPHEAIIRQALAIDADVIVAGVQPKETGGRLLLANTDWELIRHSPCPVLLIKSTRRWKRPQLVAAIDPFHAHDKPASLDRRILAAGQSLATGLHGALHAVHAFMPLPIIAPGPAGAAMVVMPAPELEEMHSGQVQKVFDRVAERFGIPAARRHLEMGPTLDEIARVVRKTRAAIVVTGAVSRSAWKRFLIGNTAERLLDHLDCDLFIVKPTGFRTRVPRRTSLAWLEG